VATARKRRSSALLMITLSAWLMTSCGKDGSDRVTIFAAASLTNAFEELVDAYETAHPEAQPELHCAGTTRLVLQLREGAPADVFASADAVQMQRVVDAGQTTSDAQTFASNRLVIVTAKDNPKAITSLADLQREGISTLMCGPEVPAGRYARAALAKANVEVVSRSDEPSVRAVLSKVKLGLVDAGIVYATDTHDADDVHTIVIPAAHNITATYPIAALSTGQQPQAGAAFVAFVMSEAGQRILTSHGFGTP